MRVEEIMDADKLALPAFTVCAEDRYKSAGFFFDRSSFLENAFTFEDLFDGPGVARLLASSSLNVSLKETWSQNWGRCFTFHTEHEFQGMEPLILPLNPAAETNTVLFFHAAGEEFWIVGDAYPSDPRSESVDTSSTCSIRRYVSAVPKVLG